jgi:hypothetical protein
MNWGKWIVVAFIFFAAFIATLVTVCLRQDISLVSSAYYQEELAYQQQIERATNALNLAEQPSIRLVQPGVVEVDFQRQQPEQGKLQLFCPSNAAMDRAFDLKPAADSLRQFDVHGLQRGMYRARMQWTAQGKEFYVEQVIHL